jgi:hypothetical protein
MSVILGPKHIAEARYRACLGVGIYVITARGKKRVIFLPESCWKQLISKASDINKGITKCKGGDTDSDNSYDNLHSTQYACDQQQPNQHYQAATSYEGCCSLHDTTAGQQETSTQWGGSQFNYPIEWFEGERSHNQHGEQQSHVKPVTHTTASCSTPPQPVEITPTHSQWQDHWWYPAQHENIHHTETQFTYPDFKENCASCQAPFYIADSSNTTPIYQATAPGTDRSICQWCAGSRSGNCDFGGGGNSQLPATYGSTAHTTPGDGAGPGGTGGSAGRGGGSSGGGFAGGGRGGGGGAGDGVGSGDYTRDGRGVGGILQNQANRFGCESDLPYSNTQDIPAEISDAKTWYLWTI